MNPVLQSWLQVFSIIVALVGVIFYQTHYVDKRLDSIDKRFDDLRMVIDARFSDLEDFIRSGIRRLEGRVERLEHPVVR